MAKKTDKCYIYKYVGKRSRWSEKNIIKNVKKVVDKGKNRWYIRRVVA